MRRANGTESGRTIGPKVVVVSLAVALVATLLATGTAAAAPLGGGESWGIPVELDPAPTGSEPPQGQAACVPPPPEVRDKSNQACDNHIRVLELHLKCARLTDQIRHRVQALRDEGVRPDPETLQKIKDDREAVRQSREILRDTAGDLREERQSLGQDRAQGDWDAVIGHLDNILEIQDTRITVLGEILDCLEDILGLLG